MTQPAPDPTAPAPAAAPAPGAEPASSVRRPDDHEIVYFEGRPQLRADQAKVILWAVLGLCLIALPILAYLLDWTWWHWAMTIACIVLAVVLLVVPMLVVRTTRYRISNYRIDFERGILKKKIDTLELWHVDDISFEQGLVDRMFNVGSIIIVSNDKTTPRLELHGIPSPRSIFDSLKQRVIAVKRQRGVIKMDVA